MKKEMGNSVVEGGKIKTKRKRRERGLKDGRDEREMKSEYVNKPISR